MNSLNTMPSATLKGKGKAAEQFIFSSYRIVILVAVASVFFPGLNPGRVSESISRNLSLFTESISYSALTSDVTRVLMRGWVDNSIFILLLKNSYKLKNSQKSCYLSDFRLFSFSPKR